MNNDSVVDYTTTPKTKQTVQALWRLEKIILDTLDFNQVVQKIVDSVLLELGYLKLGYHIVVLALVDQKTNVLKRISISQTDDAKKALQASPVPFSEINIPLTAKENLCIKALDTKQPFNTTRWSDILSPPLSEKEALDTQKQVGIKTSLIYPVVSKNESLGIIIFSMVKSEKEVSPQEKDLIASFTDIVGLAVQNAKLYTTVDETSKKLRTAYEKLKDLDKLKDEFVSVASHELRTPMTAIKSYLWMALNKSSYQLDSETKNYLDTAYVSTERLLKLVEDMLTVSRIEGKRLSLTIEPVNLLKTIEAIYNELRITAQEKQIQFTYISDINEPIINGDKDKLREVFQNLIGNALKFTSVKGQISTSISFKDNQLIVEVFNSGSFISEEDIPKLFEKFRKIEKSYTNLPQESGTGLGLYISKQIVELHGGKINVHSEQNNGTSFYVSFKMKQ